MKRALTVFLTQRYSAFQRLPRLIPIRDLEADRLPKLPLSPPEPA